MGRGEEAIDDPTNTFELGAAGQGGIGGNTLLPGLAGDDGLRQDILQLQ
jgi:hypothetical protein